MDIEDKILGNKLENYCSSSEDEAGYEDAEDGYADGKASTGAAAAGDASSTASAPNKTYFSPVEKWNGQSANTGPKGVIKDWQRYKQLETERQAEKDRERVELMKKLTISAPTTAAEDADKRAQDALDAELAELLNEDTLLEFQRQRMVEMLERTGQQPVFGTVRPLADGDAFLNAVDKEHRLTSVVVHVYEAHLAACRTMNECLAELAAEYRLVKFCKILSTTAGLSRQFKVGGVPALLVYKAGTLMGNFVRVSDELGGDEFYASDVESFLIEHGMLPDKSLTPGIVGRARNGAAGADSSDDD